MSLFLGLCAWVVWQWRGALLECGLCVLFVKINHLDKDIHWEFILNSWESRASERSGDGLWCNRPHHETAWESERQILRLPIHIFGLYTSMNIIFKKSPIWSNFLFIWLLWNSNVYSNTIPSCSPVMSYTVLVLVEVSHAVPITHWWPNRRTNLPTYTHTHQHGGSQAN